ncbi:Imm50 family immunity protein [Prescottella soli]|uniref:Imm50 family immunity protein n=1 Tax=Prescottella soli TaxID=1543852 RepID=A0ABW9FU44_9NOCA
MDWVDYLHNPEGIRAVFGNEAPSLNNVDINFIRLDTSGPAVAINFVLEKFPEPAPAKWVAAGKNAVMLELSFFVVEDVSLNGLARSMICDLRISRDADGLIVLDMGSIPEMRVASRYLSLAKMVAYARDDR